MRIWSLLLPAFILCMIWASTSNAQQRTWTDRTGRLKIEAELVSQTEEAAVLRREDGSELTVPFGNLCQQDRDYLRALREGKEPPEPDAVEENADPDDAAGEGGLESGETKPSPKPPKNSKALIIKAARDFYTALREEDRSAAAKFLTPAGREACDKAADKSPLESLPTPGPGKRSIIPGKPAIDSNVAEVPVRVRVEREMHSTRLHMRYDEDTWQVFALSAEYPDGEKSIDFEAMPGDKKGSLEALIGKTMPLSGVTLRGQPLDMSAYQGKIVLVDFWATWCGPCRKEIPNIAANLEKYHDRGFEVVAISVDKDMNALARFATQTPMPWTVIADNHPLNRERMGSKYGISGIPAFVLIGRDGKVVAVNCRGKKLGEELEKLLQAS